MSAFVAGSTGYTGREVVRALTARGQRVLAHVRPTSPRLDDWRRRFESMGAEVDSTAWDSAALTERLRTEAPAVVFALLGTTAARARREGKSPAAAYEEVDYGLTVLLLNAAVASGCRPRFVYLSVAGLDPSSRNPYLQARVRAEQAIRASGLEFCLARPSFITGSDREETRPAERAGAAVGDAFLGVIGALGARGLRARYRSTDAATLARALAHHAFAPASADQVLEGDDLRKG